jgi:RNA polymerase sigma factor (sigma-70 family)
MPLADDCELLRRYADEREETAFAEIVRRHVDLVYAVALRTAGGDAHLAKDVTHRVFTDVARKARMLAGHRVLGGWLYRAAHYAATDSVRAERRRHAREAEAQSMHELLNHPETNADWDRVRPVLDDAIAELRAGDRDAIVLRFFGGRAFAEIGAALRLTEGRGPAARGPRARETGGGAAAAGNLLDHGSAGDRAGPAAGRRGAAGARGGGGAKRRDGAAGFMAHSFRGSLAGGGGRGGGSGHSVSARTNRVVGIGAAAG